MKKIERREEEEGRARENARRVRVKVKSERLFFYTEVKN
jgi:hypothetical protein